LDWQDPDHRRGAVPEIVLAAGEILNDLTWEQHVGSVVNVAAVAYAGGTVTVRDPASVAARGEYPVQVSTVLVDAQDAVALGVLIVGRYGEPTWDLPTLQVDVVRSVDPANLAALLKLRHSSRVTIDGLPAGGGVDGTADFFLEGLSESAQRTAWRMGLAITDPRLSGVSVRWMDVPAGLEWQYVNPTLEWLDVARVEDPVDLETPSLTLDGGDASTTSFARTFDGGNAAAGTPTRTIDGGTA
jgi:hypothetical protein